MNLNSFFSDSQWVDYKVLRPLSHIRINWELQWDAQNNSYIVEEDSFAKTLNALTRELEQVNPPARYHDNEDRLAEFVRTIQRYQQRANKALHPTACAPFVPCFAAAAGELCR